MLFGGIRKRLHLGAEPAAGLVWIGFDLCDRDFEGHETAKSCEGYLDVFTPAQRRRTAILKSFYTYMPCGKEFSYALREGVQLCPAGRSSVQRAHRVLHAP